MVTVSVPGKIILMGEHAVVYGKPALIAAINRRLTVTVTKSEKPKIIASEGKEYMQHICTSVYKYLKIKEPPSLKIEISSEMPVGYHLGSSAAVAAGVVGALLYHLKKIWDPMIINQLAYEAEKFIHKNTSGVDPAAVVSGGLIWYRKELEFLRNISQFPFGIPRSLNHFFLIDTGRPKESTGEMVAHVNSKLKTQSSKLKDLFEKNEEQTKRLAMAIKEENESELIDAMRTGERTLEEMGVVSSKVTPLIGDIEKAGGAAKILGGGGRKDGVGFLLAYHHDPEQLAKIYHLKIHSIILGEEGVRREPS